MSADRRLKVREVVEAIDISHDSVVPILNIRELSAKYVLRFSQLTTEAIV